jgi:hypothetical protein
VQCRGGPRWMIEACCRARGDSWIVMQCTKAAQTFSRLLIRMRAGGVLMFAHLTHRRSPQY